MECANTIKNMTARKKIHLHKQSMGSLSGGMPGFRKTQVFLKTSPTHWVLGFWALLGFRIFYLNKQLGSLLVDLAHQLSFYLDSSVL